jgi:hypothetical protein
MARNPILKRLDRKWEPIKQRRLFEGVKVQLKLSELQREIVGRLKDLGR